MKKFGLIGAKLSHSFSPQYFEVKFALEEIENAVYEAYELEESELSSFLKNNDLDGFNVTIPYKEKIIELLDEVDPVAYEIGAVNTVKRIKDGWKGYNTDYIGFMDSLKIFLEKEVKSALVLGSGGASKAVLKALSIMEIPAIVASRNPEVNQISYDKLNESNFQNFDLIVNCTPIGTAPFTKEIPPIPSHLIHKKQIIYDLVYNPEVTELMKRALRVEAQVKNGYEMLSIQAEEAWEIWTNPEK